MHKLAALLGLAAVGLFALALIVFGGRNPDFSLIDDYVSKLGALGQPNAAAWNIVGFGAVGALLAAFGWVYGSVLNDRLAGLLLALFGVGFASSAIPVDLVDETAALSKAHVVAICLGLACWLFGLARLTQRAASDRSPRASAKIAAVLVVLPILGQSAELWPMPVTHRLVFLVVFGWTALTSVRLLRAADAEQRVVRE